MRSQEDPSDPETLPEKPEPKGAEDSLQVGADQFGSKPAAKGPAPAKDQEEVEPSSPPRHTKAEVWELSREWAGVILGILGTVLAIQAQCRGAALEKRQTRAEINVLLDQAWDLLGGDSGSERISSYNSDSSDLERARRLISNEALVLDPHYARSHQYLGLYWRARGHSDRAEASFRRALELAPDSSSANCKLGNVLMDQRRYSEAEAAYRRAMELDPENWCALNNLGGLLHTLGRHEDAEALLRRAVRLDPNEASAHGNLGVVLRALGRQEEAEAAFRRSITLDPDEARTHNNLGLLFSDQDRYQEAEASYLRAIGLDPDLTEAHENLGNLIRSQQRSEEKEPHFRPTTQED